MDTKDFSTQVLRHIPRATRREKENIRRELEDHMEDHALALQEKGIPPEAAKSKAEAAMGDPAEVGRALNEQLSPFWLGASRLAMVWLVLLCLFQISTGHFFGLERLLPSPPQKLPEPDEYDANIRGYPLSHSLDIKVPLGNDILYIYQVDLSPVQHLACIDMTVYDESGRGVAADIRDHLGAETEQYPDQQVTVGGSDHEKVIHCYVSGIHYGPEETAVTLRYERFGETLAIEVPLYGEVRP